MKKLRFFTVIFIFLTLLLQFLPVSVRADPDPEATLHVSLPAGTEVGPNTNPWLNDGWLLNITGTSGTFNIGINNTSGAVTSYDTHLIVALNDAAYNKLVSLIMRGASIPKTAFKNGTPKPYRVWNWPSGDVYPTWFNDTYINLGTILPKGYIEVTVSAQFSDPIDVMMHFDSYGSTICGIPCSSGQITWSPNSEDSTVWFHPQALQPPHAEFTYSPLSPQVCEPVTFNASLSYDPDGTIASYMWNFGDGNITTVSDAIITHDYGEPNTYSVNLTVTDNDGLMNSTIKSLTVRKHPVAAFTYSPIHPQVCEEIVFNASASTPDGGCIISYEWNFGDCSPHGFGVVVTHHYSNFGNYTVTLNVTDSEEKWDTESKIITVTAHPRAVFTYSPCYPQVLETITFDASNSTPDGGEITCYQWSFGDCNITSTSEPTIEHCYTNPGNYTVTLTVIDSEGKNDTTSDIIRVRAHPHATFTFTPPCPKVCETITFNASESTPDGGVIISYEWSFGDCSPHELGVTVTHHYEAPGNYTVTLNVTDSEGKWDTESKVLTVCVLQPPTAEFTWCPERPQVCEEVVFNASASTPNGGCIVSYHWNFGDCTPPQWGVTVTHHYTAPGNYTVILNVTDSEGLWDVESKTITVRGHPHADFAFEPTGPYEGQTVTFDASSSTPDGGYIVSYEWKFGDCSPHQFGVVVTHCYSQAGTYTVTLNVTDSEGKWDTISKNITVSRYCMWPPPKAQFAVLIEGEWTMSWKGYAFNISDYCRAFEVEVWVLGPLQGYDVKDLYGYEFWLTFDPSVIQLVDYEIKHIHTDDFIILQEVNNTIGVYKQAVTALGPVKGFNGSAPVAVLHFHIKQLPCYPNNYLGQLKLENTKMSDSCTNAIPHSLHDGYFVIYSTQPKISVQHQGQSEVTKWIVGENFTVDVVLINVVNMRSLYIELEWCEYLETSYQDVKITDFLPPPYEIYKINVTNTSLTAYIRISNDKPAVNGTGVAMRISFKVKNPWPCSLPEYTRINHEWKVEEYKCQIKVSSGYIDVYCPEYREMQFYDCNGLAVENLDYAFTPIPGDLNLDGHVDIVDLLWIAQNYGSTIEAFDLNKDGIVDLYDVIVVAKNYDRTKP